MSELSRIFDKLGQKIIPRIAGTVFPDRLTIEGEAVAAGVGGGQVRGTPTVLYFNVPCSYEPIGSNDSRNAIVGDKLLAAQPYIVTLPTHDAEEGGRINLDQTKHRLRVQERGNEPEKLFRIVTVRDHAGVIFETVCVRENQE